MGVLLFLVRKLVMSAPLMLYHFIFSFSYNAFKFQLQHGNLDHQLSAASHMLCATCAGTVTAL